MTNPTTPQALATELNRYFTSSNGVDVGARVSVPTEEWRTFYAALLRANAAGVPETAVRLADTRRDWVYLAGPMTGYKDWNFPAFHAAATVLRSEGLNVVNPADHGLIDGAEWADYLRFDIAKIAVCESIALLPGWSQSKGARLEVHVEQALGMPIRLLEGAEGLDLGASAPPAPLQAEPREPLLTITGYQLQQALEFVAPDLTPEQLTSEACIQHGPARSSDEGDDPAGLYCWLADCPEEGAISLVVPQPIEQSEPAKLPDREGVWRAEEAGIEVDIYRLEPVGGMLCLWGPDVGYMGDSSSIWDNDEWNGHIPIERYYPGTQWTFVREKAATTAQPAPLAQGDEAWHEAAYQAAKAYRNKGDDETKTTHFIAGAIWARASLPAGEPVKLDHIACIDDGELRFMSGRKAPVYDCELYAMPDGKRAPPLYAAPAQPAALVPLSSGQVKEVCSGIFLSEHPNGSSSYDQALADALTAALATHNGLTLTAPAASQGAGTDGGGV